MIDDYFKMFLKCHATFQKILWQCFWSSTSSAGPSDHCQLSWTSAGCSRSVMRRRRRRVGSAPGSANDVVGTGGHGAAVRKQLVVALTNHEGLVTCNWFQLHFVESTDRLVPGNPAEICLPASVLLAGVDTVIVFTGLVLGTILIDLTLTLSALDAGIAK